MRENKLASMDVKQKTTPEASLKSELNDKKIKHLEFKNKYRRLLISGLKKSTIRSHVNFNEGDIVYVHCGGEIIGEAIILKIEEKRLEELNNMDAKLDGFKSVEDLKDEIKKIYGNIDKIYIIKFEISLYDSPKNPKEMYYGNMNPVDVAKIALKNLELSKYEKSMLETLIKTGSIKKTAIKLGGVWKRKEVREILRKCYKLINM